MHRRTSRWVSRAILSMTLPILSWNVALANDTEPAAALQLSPIWSVRVEAGHATLLRNDLDAHGIQFPLESLHVYSKEGERENSEQWDGVRGPYVTVVPVAANGEPAANVSHAPIRLVGHTPSRLDPISVVGRSGIPGTSSSASTLNVAGVELKDVIGWVPFSHAESGVVLGRRKVVVISRGSVVAEIPHYGYEGAFARDANVGAALTLRLKEGADWPDPWGNPGSLVVFDLAGTILAEIPFEVGRSLSQLYVSHDGAWIMATEQGDEPTIAADRVFVVDVATGTRNYVPGLDGGNRCHSADSQYLASVQGGWGRIQYYQMADPANPVKISEYAGDDIVATASLNGDGSLIAISLSPRINSNSNSKSRFVVLDRHMNILAVMERALDTGYGVTIIDDLLFAGYQSDEIPRFEAMGVPGTQIDLFDIRGLR